jgi:hypothetical protein
MKFPRVKRVKKLGGSQDWAQLYSLTSIKEERESRAKWARALAFRLHSWMVEKYLDEIYPLDLASIENELLRQSEKDEAVK